MPHLRCRAISEDTVKELSWTLPKGLAALMQTDEDNFSVEFVPTSFYSMAQVVPGTPMIEVFWFSRSQDIQDKSAQFISSEVKRLLGDSDVLVVFHVLTKEAYYENGVHF